MKALQIIALVSLLLIVGCASPAPAPLPTYTPYPTLEPLSTLEPLPTHTPYPTYTAYPTYTSIPKPTDTPLPTATDTPSATRTPFPTAPPKPISELTFWDLCRYKADETKTGAQWEAYRDATIGLRVRWSGTVDDMSASGHVTVKMTDCCGLCFFDIPASAALNYSIGQTITFEGEIEEFSEVIFSDCVFVTLVNSVIV